MNVLLLSVGRRTHLVRLFIDEWQDKGKVFVADMSEHAPALYVGAQPIIVPAANCYSYIRFLVDVCIEDRIGCIIPLSDVDLVVLSEARNLFAEHSIQVVLSSSESILNTYDKQRAFTIFETMHYSQAKSFFDKPSIMSALSSRSMTFPLVIKPVLGGGSRGVTIVDNIDKLNHHLGTYNERYIVQEHLGDIEIFADVYRDCINRKVVGVFLKQKLRMRNGEADRSVSIVDEKISEFCSRIAEGLNLIGPIGMDLFVKDGLVYLSEINPRFCASYPHAHYNGLNSIKYLKNNVFGIANDSIEFSYSPGNVMLKSDSYHFLEDRELCINRV